MLGTSWIKRKFLLSKSYACDLKLYAKYQTRVPLQGFRDHCNGKLLILLLLFLKIFSFPEVLFYDCKISQGGKKSHLTVISD